MSDKLKFTNEETGGEVTETTEETVEIAPNTPSRLAFMDDPPDADTPTDEETPLYDLIAENDGGGEMPETVEDDIADTDTVTDETDATDTAEPATSKLYERESSLKFTEESNNSENPIDAPVKKNKSGFGITSDTPADTDELPHDAYTSVAVPNINPTVEAKNGDGAVETDIADSGDTVGDSADEPATEHDEGGEEIPDADVTVETEPKATEPKKPTPVKTPKPPHSTVPPAANPAIVPAGKLVKPKKPVKSANKLKFSKGENEKLTTKEVKAKAKEELRAAKLDDKIVELQYKTDLNAYKREKARAKQPTRKKKVKERVFDEKTGKAKPKLRFEEVPISINEAKWNLPKKQSLPVKGVAAATTAGINKLHSKIYQVEGDNVGTQAAHRAELVGESAVRGGKKLIHTTYRHVKNTPYRQAAKFETKTIKSHIKLDYQKALKDNPKLKSNVLSRFMQKRKIKRQYATELRDAKKAGKTLKKTGDIMAKATKVVSNVVRKNPVLLLKAGLLLLIIILIMAVLSMCVSMLSSGSGVFGAASYAAADEDINQAALAYSEWETDLRLEILNAETTHSDYDEYRYNINYIGHNPLELMAFLTAVYQDFTYADIESVLQDIFAEQYALEFIPEIEIRTRMETRTGTTTDDDGNEIEYEYEVEVEYEWHILNINLTSVPFRDILDALMTDDQKEHFNILMLTNGARQYGSTPFEIMTWIPYVTSYYGYRIHPISGAKELHRGIDIAMPEGTEILAGIDGVVTTAAYDSGFGNYVVIESADGIELKYAHCHTLLVSAGQTVTKGDVIATVGTTGSSTGNHLHMEILKDGVYLNPIYFVEAFFY